MKIHLQMYLLEIKSNDFNDFIKAMQIVTFEHIVYFSKCSIHVNNAPESVWILFVFEIKLTGEWSGADTLLSNVKCSDTFHLQGALKQNHLEMVKGCWTFEPYLTVDQSRGVNNAPSPRLVRRDVHHSFPVQLGPHGGGTFQGSAFD